MPQCVVPRRLCPAWPAPGEAVARLEMSTVLPQWDERVLDRRPLAVGFGHFGRVALAPRLQHSRAFHVKPEWERRPLARRGGALFEQLIDRR